MNQVKIKKKLYQIEKVGEIFNSCVASKKIEIKYAYVYRAPYYMNDFKQFYDYPLF